MQASRLISLPVVLWGVIFLLFLAFSLSIGGDAINGKIEGGRYYVSQGVAYQEVSRVSYVVSALIAALVGGALPVCAFFAFRREPFSEFVPRRLKFVLMSFFGLCGLLVLWAALARFWSALYGT